MDDNIKNALAALKKGQMVVLYDADEREGEADLVLSARFINPEKIETLRKDAGGLICTAITENAAKLASLPFLTDVFNGDGSTREMLCKKTAYGDKPAFSLPVNHNNVYTGITDNDRALTIKKIDEVIRRDAKEFAKEFQTPGHVFLLIGRGLENRKGHTELTLELAKRSELDGAMVLCEMLGKGKALSKEDAREYAKNHGLVFLEGKEIFEKKG